jgi:hypothetical protein
LAGLPYEASWHDAAGSEVPPVRFRFSNRQARQISIVAPQHGAYKCRIELAEIAFPRRCGQAESAKEAAMEISIVPYVLIILGTFSVAWVALLGLMFKDWLDRRENRPLAGVGLASRLKSSPSNKQLKDQCPTAA